MTNKLSVILPAKDEAINLDPLLAKLIVLYPKAEIIVVNDGSSDNTAEVCQKHGAKIVHHPYSLGNGAAVKNGTRAASGDVLVFLDADGQHDPADINQLLNKLTEGYDMVVGARSDHSQATWWRGWANRFYNRLASWITGYPVLDLTSGFRVVNTDKFQEFLYLLPNGFSYPATITMAFFRSGYPVAYVPIFVGERQQGKSHIQPIKDGMRFFLIIFKIGTLYSPLKLFFPASIGFFVLGLVYYGYTYLVQNRFTNMGMLLLVTAVLIFLMGLISEQITNLFYQKSVSNLPQKNTKT